MTTRGELRSGMAFRLETSDVELVTTFTHSEHFGNV